jgi:hypothetical protein
MRASSAPPARAWRPYLRVAFATAWIALQAVLVTTASRRADAAFGFQMFAESSTLSAQLWREVDSAEGLGHVRVPVKDGEWVARGPDGNMHTLRWRDRVIEPNLATFGVTMHAAYSASAQIDRWRAALDDVAAHLSEDAETRGLHLELVVRRNGREPVTYSFDAHPR